MDTLFEIAACRAMPLTSEQGEQLQTLCERCADYFELVEGSPPGAAAAQDLFYALPDGKGFDDKFLIGLFLNSGELIGVIDLIRDYPSNGIWYLGLLLLEPRYRNSGIGAQVYGAFEHWASSRGAQEIRLSVVEENTPAYQFWTRLGFKVIERKEPRPFGNKQHAVIVMRRDPELLHGTQRWPNHESDDPL
jgi:RimJ/RimL family protein N-acetyltransferase